MDSGPLSPPFNLFLFIRNPDGAFKLDQLVLHSPFSFKSTKCHCQSTHSFETSKIILSLFILKLDVRSNILMLNFLEMSIIFFNILLFISFGIETYSEDSPLPKCRNYQQACAIELAKFPELALPSTSTTTIPPEYSTSSSPSESEFTQSPTNPTTQIEDGEVHLDGEEEEGSGEVVADHIHFVPMGISSFPMYDEFVPTTPIYDYMAEPVERTEQQVCTCPEEETCNFENADQQISFNHQIRAAFCKPLDEVFKVKCKGTRTLARVIGELDRETEDRLSAVNDTLVFCRCHSGEWGRVMVEPWINNAFAFSYKCLNR